MPVLLLVVPETNSDQHGELHGVVEGQEARVATSSEANDHDVHHSQREEHLVSVVQHDE